MSDPKQNQNEPEDPNNEVDGAEQEPQEDPNALTEEDKKVYAQIVGSINRMNRKLESAKGKVPNSSKEQSEQPKKFDNKKASVNQIAEKLIEAKQNSDIVNKQDLITDVQQSFEEMVVDVYSENQQLKKKIESLIAIIKDQNRKINEHIDRQNTLLQENQKIRTDLMNAKDEQLMAGRTAQKPSGNKGNNSPSQVKGATKNRVNTYESQGQDYDFWSMPQNESSVKKRKDFVADSGLWVNDKDIDKSVFITDQATKGRR